MIIPLGLRNVTADQLCEPCSALQIMPGACEVHSLLHISVLHYLVDTVATDLQTVHWRLPRHSKACPRLGSGGEHPGAKGFFDH